MFSTFLDELVGTAARVLAAREDDPIVFCHAVTAPAAVRMILPWIPAEHHRATLAACWQIVGSIVAAFASPALPGETSSPPESAPAPERLAELALDHGDEHVVKLTEACLRQHAITGDDALLIAAGRFRDRIPAQRS